MVRVPSLSSSWGVSSALKNARLALLLALATRELGSLTFSLSSIKPSSGRDIDHWFLQSSKMMMFSTVDSIWKWRIGGSDLVCGHPRENSRFPREEFTGVKGLLCLG